MQTPQELPPEIWAKVRALCNEVDGQLKVADMVGLAKLINRLGGADQEVAAMLGCPGSTLDRFQTGGD